MTYKVIAKFHDNDKAKTVYEIGDGFKGKLDDARLETLSTDKNKYGKPFIEKIEVEDSGENETDEFPKDTGGGWYLLSNGDKAQGKDAAIEAEKALEK